MVQSPDLWRWWPSTNDLPFHTTSSTWDAISKPRNPNDLLTHTFSQLSLQVHLEALPIPWMKLPRSWQFFKTLWKPFGRMRPLNWFWGSEIWGWRIHLWQSGSSSNLRPVNSSHWTHSCFLERFVYENPKNVVLKCQWWMTLHMRRWHTVQYSMSPSPLEKTELPMKSVSKNLRQISLHVVNLANMGLEGKLRLNLDDCEDMARREKGTEGEGGPSVPNLKQALPIRDRMLGFLGLDSELRISSISWCTCESNLLCKLYYFLCKTQIHQTWNFPLNTAKCHCLDHLNISTINAANCRQSSRIARSVTITSGMTVSSILIQYSGQC